MRPWIAFAAILAANAAPATDLVGTGFDHFYNLEYEQALAAFRHAIARDPENPRLRTHLAQTVLYREMLRAGALETELVTGANLMRRGRLEPSPETEREFTDTIARAIELSEAKLKAAPRDRDATYALAVAYGLRGNWNFLVKRAYMDALKNITQSRKLANQVVEVDPDFIDARMVQGVHDYIVGSLPWHIRMLGFVAGFRGDKEAGIRTLKLVAEKGDNNRTDARMLLGVVYRREKRPAEAIPLLDDLIERYPRNWLFRMELGQMWADLGDKAKALAAIDSVDALRKAGHDGYGTLSAEKVAFVRGNLLYWYDDFEEAVKHLRTVVANPQNVDLHAAQTAQLRLGQIHELVGNRINAVSYYQKVVEMAPASEIAKEAKRYISIPYQRAAEEDFGRIQKKM